MNQCETRSSSAIRLYLVCIGVSVLFVFGFSVYNVADNPKDLEWCFYVNLVAVILAIIAAILLTIYDILFKRPLQ